MVVRKLNYYKLITFIVVVLTILFLIVFFSIKGIKNYNYKKTDEYKMIQLGYTKEEYDTLKSSLKDDELNSLLSKKYNKNILVFIKEKYFIFKKLDDYISYMDKNKKLTAKEVVKIINTSTNVEWIDEERDTDASKGELMLVNRLYGLSSSYEPEDIVKVPEHYAYSGKKISQSILNNIIELIDKAKESGYTLVVSAGYRSYKEQEDIYNSYKDSVGLSETDRLVARPGHSEYQTGLSVEIVPYNKVIEDVTTNEEYIWLNNNAHLYGFIFRFTKEFEDITKFDASSWRLRYVGVDAAKKIYDEKISFEEYYAYYVDRGE